MLFQRSWDLHCCCCWWSVDQLKNFLAHLTLPLRKKSRSVSGVSLILFVLSQHLVSIFLREMTRERRRRKKIWTTEIEMADDERERMKESERGQMKKVKGKRMKTAPLLISYRGTSSLV
jgi:hypothetical protein